MSCNYLGDKHFNQRQCKREGSTLKRRLGKAVSLKQWRKAILDQEITKHQQLHKVQCTNHEHQQDLVCRTYTNKGSKTPAQAFSSLSHK